MTAASVFSVVGKFLLIFCGSLLVGVCSGMATALAFKLVRLRDLHADSAAPAELICLICLSYASFMLAELGGLSGIVSALFSGAVSVTFVQHNLTPEGAALCKTAVKTLDRELLEKMALAGCKHIFHAQCIEDFLETVRRSRPRASPPCCIRWRRASAMSSRSSWAPSSLRPSSGTRL